MSFMKRAMEEIRDRGWPVNNESLERLIKEKAARKEKEEQAIQAKRDEIKKMFRDV